MRIAIDTRMIGPFMHGISRYAYNLIKGISRTDKGNDYILISNDNYLGDFVSSHENFSLTVTKSKLYGIGEQILIPRVLKKEKIDIFHSPSFFGPISSGCKVIMTIHDMIHVLFPEESSVIHKVYYRLIVKKAANNASRILTVSENSKRDLVNYLNVPPEKIVVTYNAVDEGFRRSNEDKVEEAKGRFGINGRFILYVGNQKPHKNVGLLIEAYQQLRGRIEHQLVIVGQKDRLFQKGLKGKNLEGVIFVGEISDELLSHFYSGADVFVSPSLYEGFGLPIIEAFACKTPVVAVRTPSVDEIMGNAGLIVDAGSTDKLANAIHEVLSNDDLRNSLVEKGMARVEMFSWRETVDRTLEVYREVHRSIRVGINASKYFDIHTGVGRYTSNLCRSISKGKDGNDYYFYLPGRNSGPYGKDENVAQLREKRMFLQNNTLRILWEQILLPIKIRRDRLDLFHYTDHAMSLIQRIHPTVITVHDIAYIRFPDLLNKSRQVYKKYILYSSIKKADVIIADSHSTRRDIVEFFNVDEKKIKVVHLGVESRFRPISSVEDYRTKNNLPSKMILNIGTLEPRKNVVTLIKAFKKLQEGGFKDYVLVIAGEKGWLYKRIFEEIKSSGVEQSIRLLGVANDEDLPLLYNCADLFVYPSLYEGFGLPPLEAMACGVPVITSNTSSLPEVVGNAGIMVNPSDIESLSDEMWRVLKDEELKHRMSRDGLKRSKMFTSEKTVSEVLEIYNEFLSENN